MTDSSPRLSILPATVYSEELYQACLQLVPQLTQNNPPPTREELSAMLSSASSTLFIARHSSFGGSIIGMATVILYHVPTGLRAVIEDVVVDERARGKHIGEALTRACLDRAEQSGALQVMLTSNPGREAANRLYQQMGFELRHTNVYRYAFKKS